MVEAARTSETSVDIQLRTRQYIPEDSELHTLRRENLRFHVFTFFYFKNTFYTFCNFNNIAALNCIALQDKDRSSYLEVYTLV
jgi:hypothetical protein